MLETNKMTSGKALAKVIIETCSPSEEEKTCQS